MEKSKIARAIKMKNYPVAVIKSSHKPDDCLQFKEEAKGGCLVSMLLAAAKGSTAVFSEETTPCNGGKVGLGFKSFEMGAIEYFLSTGKDGMLGGEHYKKTPELARSYIQGMPQIEPTQYLIVKPLQMLEQGEIPEVVVFFVNADQLSALVTLANYDQETQDSVQIKFGAGCAQAILFAMKDSQDDSSKCTIGLTDPSARSCIDKELLSFSIPYNRFLQMEEQVDESFLTKKTWLRLAERI